MAIDNITPSKNIHALAYPLDDNPFLSNKLLLCSLAIRCKDGSAAIISLDFSIPIHHFDKEQTFTLLCKPSNLRPTCKLEHPTGLTNFSRDQLQTIARHESPNLTRMSLVLKERCPIRCTLPASSIKPKPNLQTTFDQFGRLASATSIGIFFDYSWIPTKKRQLLKHLLDEPDKFTSLEKSKRNSSQTNIFDFSVFIPVKVTGDSLGDSSDDLPSYNVACKRPRSQSLTSPLLSKRACVPASPTEPASSPKLLQEVPNAREFKMVATVLRQILPDVLPGLFAIAPTPSNTELSASTSTSQTLPEPTHLNTLLAACLEPHLTALYNRALSKVETILEGAEADCYNLIQGLQEEMNDELTSIKRDDINEVWRTGFDVLQKCEEEAEALKDKTTNEILYFGNEVFDDVSHRLRALQAVTCHRCENGHKKVPRGARRLNLGGQGGYRNMGGRFLQHSNG